MSQAVEITKEMNFWVSLCESLVSGPRWDRKTSVDVTHTSYATATGIFYAYGNQSQRLHRRCHQQIHHGVTGKPAGDRHDEARAAGRRRRCAPPIVSGFSETPARWRRA